MTHIGTFKASKGWYDKFNRRYDLLSNMRKALRNEYINLGQI